jgi:hypothetical protein
MTAILQFIIITAIAAAFTRKVLGKRVPEFDSVGERLIFESAIGLGLLALLIFALGIFKLFCVWSFIALLLLMAMICWRALTGVISDAIDGLKTLKKIEWKAEALIAGVIMTTISLLVLIRALAPPVSDDWDSLAYHLAMPKLFLAHHGFYYIDFSSHSNFPFAWEMLYTLGLAFRSIALAKLFHFGAGALLLRAVFCLGKRHFSRESGRLAALLIVGIPLIAWESMTAYIDLATALYSFLAVYALMNFSATRDRKWAIIAGISAGTAAGTKMTALMMLAVVVVWILWPTREPEKQKSGSRIKTAAIAGLLAVMIAAPWYIKTWVYTGNPVYPFAYSVFGGKNWSAKTAEAYRTDQLKFGMGKGIDSFLSLPWNLTFRFTRFNDYGARMGSIFEAPLFSGNTQAYLASIGPMLLILLPIIILTASKPGRHRPLFAVSIGLTAAWFIMMQNTRYLLPMLAILSPGAAYAVDLLKVRKVIFAVATAAGTFTIILLANFVTPSISVALGTEEQNDYLQRFNLYAASQSVNQAVPKGSKIALFGETRGFYLDRDYMWADPGHNAIIPYDQIGPDSNRLLNWLSSHGISYILVNYGNYPTEDNTLVGQAIANDKLEEIGSSYPISIYRIKR